jgi:nitrogen regulatory protein P-II 1
MLVTAVIRPHKVQDVRDALRSIGSGSMTISEVQGFGNQRGHQEVYRGMVAQVDAVPHIRVDVVVSDGSVPDVVDHIVDAAETELVGDGKVWVIPVTDLVRIRTGESGVDAL